MPEAVLWPPYAYMHIHIIRASTHMNTYIYTHMGRYIYIHTSCIRLFDSAKMTLPERLKESLTITYYPVALSAMACSSSAHVLIDELDFHLVFPLNQTYLQCVFGL